MNPTRVKEILIFRHAYFATLFTNFKPIVIAKRVPNTIAIKGKLSPIIPTISVAIPDIEEPIESKMLTSKNVGTYASGLLNLMLSN